MTLSPTNRRTNMTDTVTAPPPVINGIDLPALGDFV